MHEIKRNSVTLRPFAQSAASRTMFELCRAQIVSHSVHDIRDIQISLRLVARYTRMLIKLQRESVVVCAS